MDRPYQAQSHQLRSHSRYHIVLAPLLVVLLLGQFAPVGLMTSATANAHDCPHCAGLVDHGTGGKCPHEVVDSDSPAHHGMAATAHHSARPGEAFFRGCGSDGTSLTIVPPIGKTLTVSVFSSLTAESADLGFAEPRDGVKAFAGLSPFHPPRFV